MRFTHPENHTTPTTNALKKRHVREQHFEPASNICQQTETKFESDIYTFFESNRLYVSRRNSKLHHITAQHTGPKSFASSHEKNMVKGGGDLLAILVPTFCCRPLVLQTHGPVA